MAKHFDSFVKKTAAIFSAGMLLQVGGCGTDITADGSALLSLILQRLISDIVFGAFNVSTMGF